MQVDEAIDADDLDDLEDVDTGVLEPAAEPSGAGPAGDVSADL